MMKEYVFAYGSNMNYRQMAERCPGAKAVCVGRLPDHRLVFLGRSPRWGGGVASIGPRRRSSVCGIVWQMPPRDLERLDGYEGYPYVYDRVTVPVEIIGSKKKGAPLWCSTYVKESDRHETQPSALYLSVILDGYDWAGLPVPRRLKTLLAASQHHVP